jgi:hypothetical protein
VQAVGLLVAITIGCAKVPLIRSWNSKAGVAGVGIAPEPDRMGGGPQGEGASGWVFDPIRSND